MNKFNEKTATAEELYEWCMKEYSSANPLAKWVINNFYKKLETKIIKPFILSSKNIIEIGCGAAESTRRILKMVGVIHYEATEYDYRYIEAVNSKDLPYKLTREDVYDIQKSDNTYECVIMLEVLEHLENYKLALKELFRISSKYVIISVPYEPFWRILNLFRFRYIKQFGNTPGHINHWGRRKLKKIFSDYGEIVKLVSPLPWIIILIKKNDN